MPSARCSGVDIEDSHVKDRGRMSNLFSIIMIAYVWCYLVGIFYSRKHQTDKGPEAWAKGCELVQIWTGLHLTMPYEPYRPISNQYFQIFVIYLEDVQQDSPSFTSRFLNDLISFL